MFSKLPGWISLLFSLAVLACAGFAADNKGEDEDEKKHPFSVKFVDEDGQPVEGVIAGDSAYFGGEGNSLPVVDESNWRYYLGAKSDANGIASFPDGRDRDFLCVAARQTTRKLAAIWKIEREKLDPKNSTETVTITMRPECRISGRIECSELKKRGREIGWTNVYLEANGSRALGCSAEDQTFHFFVPAGEYSMDLYGANLHSIEKTITVKAGQTELDVGAVDLPATQLALLQGQPAPALEGLACWKNGPAVNLADLKGKCVLLEFWGYWCGPCVHRMPKVFEVYDKYHDAGLEVVGIHVDLGEDEKEPVDTVEKLDARLTKTREELWKGRDLPFPVGLVCGKRTAYDTTVELRKARSPISARYGVTSYPTLILIDRNGNVVGRYSPGFAQYDTLLEEKLKEQPPQ